MCSNCCSHITKPRTCRADHASARWQRTMGRYLTRSWGTPAPLRGMIGATCAVIAAHTSPNLAHVGLTTRQPGGKGPWGGILPDPGELQRRSEACSELHVQ